MKSRKPKTSRHPTQRQLAARSRFVDTHVKNMRNPMSGEPCTFNEWKRAEIARIMDKDD